MTNQQGAPEALRPIQRFNNFAGLMNPETRGLYVRYEDHVAAIAALHAAHVQNPAEIEHVAGDVSKNGAELNTSTQQPTPAAGVTVEQVEDAIGLQSTAWDTIGAEKIVEAVLRLTNGQAPATQQAGEAWAGVDAQGLREGFTAADMATAEARGFRDGAASAMAGEPMAWMTFTEEGDPDMVFRDRLEACQYCEDDDPPKPLYLAAPPTAQAEGWISVSSHHLLQRDGILGKAGDVVTARWPVLPQPSPTPQADSQPAPVLDRARIREIFMAHGFTVKEGQTDLKQYVYDAAGALLRAARAPADSAQEDAARYRFLRDGEWRGTDLEPFIRLQLNTLWDAKIDAARKQGANHDRADWMAPISANAGRLQGVEQVACKAGLLHLLEAESEGGKP